MNTKNLPNLDKSVLAALNFFTENPPIRLNLQAFSFPLVVGSGNAYNAGSVIFGNHPAIIANESNFKQIIKNHQSWIKNKSITQALIISASGEKDSTWETRLAKKYGLKTTLLTCSPNSSAAQIADEVIVYKKLPEPYTYNTSTYLGMFLGVSSEKAETIKKFLKKIKLPNNFKNYAAYSFLLPDKFGALAPMLEIKKDELFGPRLSLRAFSFGEARHAKFINAWDKELVISLGENKYFGFKTNRWEIKLPSNAGIGFIMALTYYIIGKIQETKTPYFKKNITKFCLEGPKAYGQKNPFPLIVK
ncbi:MAG: hypothetical protein WC249_03025 [Patescibacteria group bacterium]|jgi:hypothetical protein